MTGFFSKLFGGKKDGANNVSDLVSKTLTGVIEKSGFELDFELRTEKNEQDEDQLVVDFTGPDEELLKEKEAQLIEAFQLLLKRVVQHNFPEDRTGIVIDCNGYREENSQALTELADKLKGIALEKGKPVYFRALAPKDRKIIHQYLSTDERIKSRSVGDGLYKKIKIYPVKNHQSAEETSAE